MFVVFSYHPEHPWVAEETKGMEDVLKDKGLTVEKFYMDTKRRTSPEWMKQIADDAIKKIEKFRPDLVMVFDDNACELVAKKYIGKTLPIVFAGMNREPADYGFPTSTITGVVEREHFEETIHLLQQLSPGVKKAAILTENSLTSQGFADRVEKIVSPVEITHIYQIDDFGDWQAKAKELQTQVDAIGLFVYHTLKEKGRETSVPAETVLNWTLNNSRLPEFAFFNFTVRGGALGGVTLSGYEQGKTGAEIALQILNGKKPARIPVQSPKQGNPMVNETRAKELRIGLPEGILKEVEVVP